MAPINTPGDNPFMPPVGGDEANVAAPAQTGGAFTGDTPGLYGGTRNAATCDPQRMVDFLKQNPDKAAAWAGVLGIAPETIESYVATIDWTTVDIDLYTDEKLDWVDGRVGCVVASADLVPGRQVQPDCTYRPDQPGMGDSKTGFLVTVVDANHFTVQASSRYPEYAGNYERCTTPCR